MRRRVWILGGGAAAVVAAGFAERRNIVGLIKGCGLPPWPPPRATNVRVAPKVFRSHILNADVGTVTVFARPKGIQDAKPLVIFALPGRDGTAADQVNGLHLADYFGNAVWARGNRDSILVVVDSGSSYWHARRHGEDRMRMLIDEIVSPSIRRYNLHSADTGIIGWSMGAYGALLAVERFPSLFGAACGVSVALWQNAGHQQAAVPDAFDDAADFDRNDLHRKVAALAKCRLRIACGTSDPFLPADEEFARGLQMAGLKPEIDFSAGCHDDGYWQKDAPASFQFLIRALAR